MSSQITGGTVTFLRRVKTGEYEHKEASAVITFSVPDGDGGSAQGTFDRAFEIAQTGVLQRLGLVQQPARPPVSEPAKPTVQAPPSTGAEVGGVPASSSGVEPTSEPASRPKRAPRKPPTVVSGISAEEIEQQKRETRGQISTNPEDRTEDPLGDGLGTTGTSGATETQTQEADPLGDGLDDLLSPAAEPVTDKQLVDAISVHANATKNSPAIRLLIGKYVAPPKTAREIPLELRPKFIEELALIGKP